MLVHVPGCFFGRNVGKPLARGGSRYRLHLNFCWLQPLEKPSEEMAPQTYPKLPLRIAFSPRALAFDRFPGHMSRRSHGGTRRQSLEESMHQAANANNLRADEILQDTLRCGEIDIDLTCRYLGG